MVKFGANLYKIFCKKELVDFWSLIAIFLHANSIRRTSSSFVFFQQDSFLTLNLEYPLKRYRGNILGQILRQFPMIGIGLKKQASHGKLFITKEIIYL